MNGGSGSGGFYKYRCKYFYTYNCSNWVYVSQAPCANCLVSLPAKETGARQHSTQPRAISNNNNGNAHTHTRRNKGLTIQKQAEGRDSAEAQVQQPFNKPREIQVPYFDDNGMLQYSLMELVNRDQSGLYWAVQQKVAAATTNPQQQPQLYRMPATTSDQPRAPIYGPAVLQGHA